MKLKNVLIEKLRAATGERNQFTVILKSGVKVMGAASSEIGEDYFNLTNAWAVLPNGQNTTIDATYTIRFTDVSTFTRAV